MSMNNCPTVVMGKIFNQSELDEVLWEYLIEGKWGKLVAQFGESNYKRSCIGYVLGEIGPYDGNREIIIMDDVPRFLMLKEEIFHHILKTGLSVERDEIKLYFRDQWG